MLCYHDINDNIWSNLLTMSDMKNLIFTMACIAMLGFTNAQTFTSKKDSKCKVQVALAVSEADGFGEYSITKLVDVDPGMTVSFRNQEFVRRQIYSKVEFDEMFIIRFEPTGITHYVDATVSQGFETYLNGGCALEQRPFLSRDGAFIIDASGN